LNWTIPGWASAGSIVRILPSFYSRKTKLTRKKLFGVENSYPNVKDGINDYIVNGVKNAVAVEPKGTKAAAHYESEIGAGQTVTVRLRLTDIDFSGRGGRCIRWL